VPLTRIEVEEPAPNAEVTGGLTPSYWTAPASGWIPRTH